jgi:glutathione synthase/RimK-type ligase-like ATP-grasp enzyme
MQKITILTCAAYLQLDVSKPYEANIKLEYDLLKSALEKKGVTVERTNWDNTSYDFSSTDAVVFRTIWDYFERSAEFEIWLKKVSELTKVINPLSLVSWNIDKHYLADLQAKGIAIMDTVFVDTGAHETLQSISKKKGWKDIVIKPAISGAAFHTYKIMASEIAEKEDLFKQLVAERDMLVQEFQPTIMTKGEASLMVFNGKFTHAVLKKAKEGDFRVQDDFGGTVHSYEPTKEEIAFAEKTFAACDVLPAYGRADIVWDKNDTPQLSELEIVEPELWVRNYPDSANDFADGIIEFM